MPTVIDSLVVKLGLDAKGMEQAAPASTKQLKNLEEQGAKTESTVSSLSKAIAGFLALVGGTMAIRAFIDDQVTMNAELERMAKNLGVNVSTLSAWGNAVEEVGGTASGLQGTMDMLSKSQTELRLTGQSSLIPYFSALGVSLATVAGQARPLDAILLDLSDRFSHMDRTTANNMGRMMGIDQDTMNLLLMGRKELELTIARQKEHNAVTREQAEQAVKLQRAMVDTKQSFSALGRQLLEQATPALEWFAGMLQKVGTWAQRNSQFIGDFAKVLGTVAVGVAAIGLAASPLALITAGVMALAAAIALLWQDYQTWKRGGDSLINWGKWEPELRFATAAIHSLSGALDALKSSFAALQMLRHGNIKGAWNEYVNGGGPTILDRFESYYKAHKGNAPVTSDAARAEAARVSAKTGIPADILYAQWSHETNGFKNRGATTLNNLAGVNIPGGKGKDYRSFKSLDEFGDYYAYLMRSGGRYSGAANARTPEEFAAILKQGGYYSDTESNYAAGMLRALSGAPGATSMVANAPQLGVGGRSTTSTDSSVTNHIGTINVQTQATNGAELGRYLSDSKDFLFTSQANAGLF